MKPILLESYRLVYKPLSLMHLSHCYLEWLNDPEVYQFLETGENYTMEMLEKYLLEIEQKAILSWGIHLKSNNKHIGNIKIDPVSEWHGLGEYGILIGEKTEWCKGYAREASSTILSFCFDKARLRKITLGVVEDNKPAVRLYESLGFKIEGIYHKHGLYNGKYCDVLRMALFNPDWIGYE